MKPQHYFIAERIAAQHCQELLRRAPDPADLIPALTRLGERLAVQLAPALGALLGGDAPRVAALPAQEIGKADLLEEAGSLAANSLLACSIRRIGLITSVDGLAVLGLVDRAFGGRGEHSGPLPAAFPLSAELMVARLDELIVAALAEALGLADLHAAARNTRLGELARFPAATRLALLRLSISEGSRSPWQVRIAVPIGQLPDLIARAGTGTGSALAKPSNGAPQAADPAAAPFAGMPLPLTATLVDMQIPLSVLAGLEPGSVLPVALARAVPLSIGSTVLARGTIGAQDERVAIKLSQIA